MELEGNGFLRICCGEPQDLLRSLCGAHGRVRSDAINPDTLREAGLPLSHSALDLGAGQLGNKQPKYLVCAERSRTQIPAQWP